MQPNETTRVIYAKLTSTGAYDVVGKTRGIELDAARELAERVQPGNIPYDSKLSEGLAYLRPTEGGHLIARYAPYAWRDAHGRGRKAHCGAAAACAADEPRRASLPASACVCTAGKTVSQDCL